MVATEHQGVNVKKLANSTLQALTTAALALPGLMLTQAYAAEEEVDFQYGHYQEGKRELFGVKSRFQPIEVESLQNNAKFKISDRIRLALNYTQDTWGGATPIATAPLAFSGNREGGLISGATPFLQNNNIFFDKQLNPLQQNPLTGQFRKSRQLVHTLSSASPETRKQGAVKFGYAWNKATLDIGGGVSVEHDYESRFGSLNGSWDFNNKLTTLYAGLSYTNSATSALLDHDAVPYIEKTTFNNQVQTLSGGGQMLHGNRQDWAVSLGLTQVLNKNALVEANAGYTRSTGYMANPYKVVEVAFVDPHQKPGSSGELRGDLRAFLEKRPDERNQWVGNLHYVQHIDAFDAALHFNYRFFHDDWGINAHTFEADWGQPLGDGWTFTPGVRYYSQDAADFYHPYLISLQAANKITVDPNGNIKVTPYNPKLLPANYTSDHRLSAYGALSGGITLSKQFARGVSLVADAQYYTHAGILKLGGGGESSYADFGYFAVNAAVKVDMSALSLAGFGGAGGHDAHDGHHAGHARHGNRAPAGVLFDHMLGKAGDFMVGYRYMYASQAGTMLHGAQNIGDQALVNQGCGLHPCYVTPTEMTMNMHMFDLMYAPTDWLNLMFMPQFVDMHMLTRSLAGAPPIDFINDPGTAAAVTHAGHEHITGGIGDTGLYALFKLFDDVGQQHVHATLGLSAPTGDSGIKLRDTHRQQLGFIHYGMQLGSGTWDFKPSITYIGQSGFWSWGAQLNGTIRMETRNDSGFAFGDVFQSTAWGSYNLLDWLSASVRGVYTVQGRLRGAYNGTYHPVGPMDNPANYGGRYWDVGFGLSAFVPSGTLQGNRLSFEWLQPVHDDVNGYQLSRESALSASWSYAF